MHETVCQSLRVAKAGPGVHILPNPRDKLSNDMLNALIGALQVLNTNEASCWPRLRHLGGVPALQSMSSTNVYLITILSHLVQTDVVDNVPGSDQDRIAVHLQQLEVIPVRLVAMEAQHLVLT